VGCNKLTVNFRVNADPGVNQYIWNFDDAGTSNDARPSHQFINTTNVAKTYRVTVQTSSPQYCSGHDTVNVTVQANLDPLFSIDVPKTCAPYNATISNNSHGGITDVRWDFGDGTLPGTSGASSFKHMYYNTSTSEATYTVKLIVQNSGGCKDSVSHDITLYPEVRADFSDTLSSYCSPRRVVFVNRSNAVATKFIWNFGDNATSMARDTVHYYINNTQRDTNYFATLIAISDYNCADTMKSILPILVYPYFKASFAVDTAVGCNPLTVNITNGSQGPFDSRDAQRIWNFSDGTQWKPDSIPPSFKHTFYNTGQLSKPFNIILTIVYKSFCSYNASTTITVYSPITPKVSADKTIVCNNSEITFKDSTYKAYKLAYNYKWDFGDNSSSNGLYSGIRLFTKHKFENSTFSTASRQVKFSAYTQMGCHGDTTFNVTVFPDIKASFSFDDAAGCSPFTVPLKDASSIVATWKRFWDDENTPSTGFPYTYLPEKITYLNDTSTTNKTYKPKLKVAYLYNNGTTTQPVCPDSIVRTITVYPKVTAYFAAKDSFQICHPDTVNFANGSRIGKYKIPKNDNRLAYKWTFGDNGSSSDYEPMHLYNNFSSSNSSLNTVWLKVNSYYDCKDSISKTVTVFPKPAANFDVENSLACPPFNVQIDHMSIAEDGSMYNWTFDGVGNDTVTRASNETLYHLFGNSGTTTISHPIHLLVTTPHNCTDTISQSIFVYPPVKAEFDKDASGCSPFNITFINKSEQADSWFWNFGETTYLSTSKAKNPPHTFINDSTNDITYTISMKAMSNEGCRDSIIHKVTVYPQPKAEFIADREYFVFSPTSNIVNFTNQTTPDAAWNYEWNYDDGLPFDRIKGPTHHEFLLGPPHWGGQFNVKLRAQSDHCSDSVYHRITIVAPKPVADFSISENGCVPLELSFTELTSYGTGWFWEFGDGGTYNGQNPPPYTYTKAGKFNIKLTVTGDGGVSYAYKDVEVYPKPIVNFDVKPSLVMLTEKMEAKVQFYNKCQLGERFEWDFGDSTKSVEQVPSHIYKSMGTYTVKLGAWTVHQCYDEIIKKDTVEVLEKHDLVFPNAFTPDINGQNDGRYADNKNEVFHPKWKGVVEYHLEIYDRWGEKLFESDDVLIGWNGYYKGKLCKTDVYIWKVKGKYTDGSTFEKAGNVTLLR
jgi:gliding motility-associated-like protein